jgi:hypothetical protein
MLPLFSLWLHADNDFPLVLLSFSHISSFYCTANVHYVLFVSYSGTSANTI